MPTVKFSVSTMVFVNDRCDCTHDCGIQDFILEYLNDSHKGKCGTGPQILYVLAAKLSRNSLIYFTGIVTLNKDMYIHVLRRICDAVGRKRPEKWKTNSWFLCRDNAPAHRPVLVKDFLAKNKETTQEHPSYSTGLATAVVDTLGTLCTTFVNAVIPRLTKIIRSGIKFVSRNVNSRRFL
jgi:hypothetical protein